MLGVLNYLIHQELTACLYFGAVLCGLMVFYRLVELEKGLFEGVIRYVAVLCMALLFHQEISFLQSMCWFVLSVLGSFLTQRVQKSSAAFLESLCLLNLIAGSLLFCAVLFQPWLEWDLSFVLMAGCVLFQPSGVLKAEHFSTAEL